MWRVVGRVKVAWEGSAVRLNEVVKRTFEKLRVVTWSSRLNCASGSKGGWTRRTGAMLTMVHPSSSCIFYWVQYFRLLV
jgi:hypothetical protein